MTDVYRLVEAFGRGLTLGLLSTHSEARKEPVARTPRLPRSRELPGQLPLFGPNTLPESLQNNERNGEPIAPGAGVYGDMPAPPLTQRDIELIEARLRGEVPPDTYVPDNVEMEKKVGA